MKRNLMMRKGALSVLAALFLTAGFSVSAQTISPATGEPPANPLPYVLAAVGIVAIILVVVLTVLDKKKKNRQTPPTDPTNGGTENAPTDWKE